MSRIGDNFGAGNNNTNSINVFNALSRVNNINSCVAQDNSSGKVFEPKSPKYNIDEYVIVTEQRGIIGPFWIKGRVTKCYSVGTEYKYRILLIPIDKNDPVVRAEEEIMPLNEKNLSSMKQVNDLYYEALEKHRDLMRRKLEKERENDSDWSGYSGLSDYSGEESLPAPAYAEDEESYNSMVRAPAVVPSQVPTPLPAQAEGDVPNDPALAPDNEGINWYFITIWFITFAAFIYVKNIFEEEEYQNVFLEMVNQIEEILVEMEVYDFITYSNVLSFLFFAAIFMKKYK